MAYGKKTGGRNFKPGQSGNPSGQKNMGMANARKISVLVFSEIVTKYMNLTLEQVNDHFKDPQTPALDLIVLKILYEGIKKGDQIRLGFLLERTIGKVKDVIDHTSSDKSMSPGTKVDISSLTKDELKVMMKVFSSEIKNKSDV